MLKYNHSVYAHHRRPHVLLAASGSVAAIKVPELFTLLSEWADVRLIATTAARHFFSAEDSTKLGKIYGALLLEHNDGRCLPCTCIEVS